MPRFKAFASSDSEDEGSASSSSSPEVPARELPVAKSVPLAVATRPQADATQSESESPESTEEEESEEDDSEDMGAASDMEEDELTPDEDVRQPEPKSWAKQLDLEPHRVNVMQSSLFRTSEISKPIQEKSNAFLKQSRPAEMRHDLRPSSNRTSFTQPRAQPPARKYVRVSGTESKTKGKESVYLDAGLSMGRSFRVGWGPGNKLVHVGQLQSRSSSSPSVLFS